MLQVPKDQSKFHSVRYQLNLLRVFPVQCGLICTTELQQKTAAGRMKFPAIPGPKFHGWQEYSPALPAVGLSGILWAVQCLTRRQS